MVSAFKTATILPLAALALAALGCSHVASLAPDAGTGDTDTDTDTGTETETETDVGLWNWTCTLPPATSCDEFEEAPSPYWASLSIPDSSNLRYVHASRSPVAILAERTVGEAVDPVVLLLRDGYDDIVEVGLISPPAEQLEAIDIASPPDLYYGASGLETPESLFGYPAIALLCGETSCALYGLAVDESDEPIGLEPIPGCEVPLPESRAMAFTLGIDDAADIDMSDTVCVAGDGVACFHGGVVWSEEVAPGGNALNSVDVEYGSEGGPQGFWAAGEGGRIATNRSGEWTEEWAEIDSGTSMNFTAISVHDGVWAAGGETGFAFGDLEHAIACESDTPYTAVFVHEEGPSSGSFLSLTALAADQAVELFGTNAGFEACLQPEPFSRPPVNADYRLGCIDAVCGYALTDQGLYERTEYGGGFE